MEPSSDITALNWPAEMTCVVTEPCARRYLEGQAIWDEKYAKTAKKVKEKRERHVLKAAKDTEKLVVEMEKRLKRASTFGVGNGNGNGSEGSGSEDGNGRHPLLNDPLFSWGWALDGENPPPSSLVARRDTAGSSHPHQGVTEHALNQPSDIRGTKTRETGRHESRSERESSER